MKNGLIADLKKVRAYVCFAALCLTIFSGGGCSQREVVFPEPDGYVTDNAGVLSSRLKAEVAALCGEVEGKTGAEIAVATVKSTYPLSIEQYAVQLFERWGIGKAEEDNGLLLVLAVDDRKVRIEVGYGLESVVTDAESGFIIREFMIPTLKQGDYNMAVARGVIQIAKIIRDAYGVEIDPVYKDVKVANGGRQSEEETSPLSVLLSIIFVLLILGSRFWPLFFVMSSGRRGYWSGGSGGSFGGGFGGFGGGLSGGGGASGSW